MKRNYTPCYLLVCFVLFAWALASCSKIDLSDYDDDGKGNKPDVEQPDTVPQGGSDADGEDKKEYYTVTEALKLPLDTFVSVRGYVVGGILNSKRIYAAKGFTAPNTALLLADATGETTSGNTFAIALKADMEGLRAQLNLYDHPEWFGRCIEVKGLIEKYYGRNGMKDPDARFSWIQIEEPGEPDLPDSPDPGIDPENPGEGTDDPDNPDPGSNPDNPGGGTGGTETPGSPVPPALKDSVGHVEDGR